MNKLKIMFISFLPAVMMICGCSFSESSKSFSKSSKSISKSASSPSRWSSRSSRRNENSVDTVSYSYQDEISALTALYAKSGGTSQNFQQELSMISNNHGIIDWENNPQTYQAIGIGLKRGAVAENSIKTLPFLQNKNDFDNYSIILAGYNSGQ